MTLPIGGGDAEYCDVSAVTWSAVPTAPRSDSDIVTRLLE
jgi:hypothetical protein